MPQQRATYTKTFGVNHLATLPTSCPQACPPPAGTSLGRPQAREAQNEARKPAVRLRPGKGAKARTVAMVLAL